MHSTCLTSSYLTSFNKLDNALFLHRSLWQPKPFIQNDLPWQHQYPELHHSLLSLNVDKAEQLATDNSALELWFQALIPTIVNSIQGFTPSKTTPSSISSLSHRDALAIPGRKWQQITAFASSLPSLKHPLVEWCSGKGHLGRILNQLHHQPVFCIEIDPALCKIGEKLAAKQQQALIFHQHDAMNILPNLHTDQRSHIGLHACGKLHMHLLKVATEEGAPFLAISPCCYHKINTPIYHPLSQTASTAKLQLGLSDLHLAQEETITASTKTKHLRQQEQSWRLGFDELQKNIRKNNHYQPVPSINKTIFTGSFSDFCQWAASTCQLTLPSKVDYAYYLQQGINRRNTVVKLELLRQLFRRPLEFWLALDRVLFLEEQGYTADLHEFCDRMVTPRNLLITATKNG